MHDFEGGVAVRQWRFRHSQLPPPQLMQCKSCTSADSSNEERAALLLDIAKRNAEITGCVQVGRAPPSGAYVPKSAVSKQKWDTSADSSTGWATDSPPPQPNSTSRACSIPGGHTAPRTAVRSRGWGGHQTGRGRDAQLSRRCPPARSGSSVSAHELYESTTSSGEGATALGRPSHSTGPGRRRAQQHRHRLLDRSDHHPGGARVAPRAPRRRRR